MNTGLFWFRRDLRLADHPALERACQSHDALLLVYVDADARQPHDASRAWLRRSLELLGDDIRQRGGELHVLAGDPETLIPALANPVVPGCREAIDDPARTMLGASQEATFLEAIKASNATFKVVVNEVPIQQFYQLPYDRWEGYAAARTRLLKSLASVKNIVFLTTDTHANLFGEIRLQTLEGPPIGTGIWEAVTGPVATNTYSKEIDSAIGAKGTGDFVTSLFLKPAPPRGIGMACAATDVFSYSEVVVTASQLTVTPKTASGRRVAEKTGAVCAPLVVTAR